MEFVEILRDRRAIGQAFMLDDCLHPDVRLRRRRFEARRREQRLSCPHLHVVDAFAYRRSRDEHWPVTFCDDCLQILAGRDPLLRLVKRPRWRFDEQNRIVRRWVRQWPRPGRPRRSAPPVEVAWPDAA